MALHAVGDNEAEDLISNLPAGLMERLFPYQRAGVATAVRCGGRTLLADEMVSSSPLMHGRKEGMGAASSFGAWEEGMGGDPLWDAPCQTKQSI